MARRWLRIIGALGVLCATAAVAVFVPAASAVLPGDGGGGYYVVCPAGGLGQGDPAVCEYTGYEAAFKASKAGSPCPGYFAKVLNVRTNATLYNTYFPCQDGIWRYTGILTSSNQPLRVTLQSYSGIGSWRIEIYYTV